MGYRRNYEKLPYQIHEERWNNFDANRRATTEYLNRIKYDGFEKNCYEDKFYLNQYPSTAISDIVETQYSKLFLLPCKFLIYPQFIFEEPIEPPELPDLPSPPPVQFDGEYPEWYKDKGYIERDISQRERKLTELEELRKNLHNKAQEFERIYAEIKAKRNSIISGITLLSPNVSENEALLLFAHNAHYLPDFLRKKYISKIVVDSRVAIIQFQFPDYSDVNIVSGYKIVKYDEVPKFYSETQKKKLVKTCLFSLIIRSAVLAANFNPCNLFDSVIVNVEQDWFDPATGQQRNGIIATLQASNEYLNSLDLTKLDPESCFKYLKGISTQNVLNSSPVRPIFVLDKEDERFIENKAVDIEDETNLAAMDWEDFEHLVAQLFEWEFAKNGVEVKVTRASRDRGVDAILFDPDPLRGGKYVLQAKRYTRTVDVSAVRDLYGTIMNEGANRGIIITTASFGPDAYEFSKDKPISLVDGQNLLMMLQKHGKKFKIDLEEARQLNIENQR